MELREVVIEDIPIFYEHQADPAGAEMAAVDSKDYDAHAAHWAKNLNEPTSVHRTIVFEGEVVGNCVSWVMEGHRYIGYWIGRSFWGRGIASAALIRFLEVVTERPVYATVADHNAASLRVLQKAGFVPSEHVSDPDEDEVALLSLELT